MEFNEHLVLELTIRFELSVPKGVFSWALQASVGSLESVIIKFFESTMWMTSHAFNWTWNFVKLDEHFVLELTIRFELLVSKGGFS